MANALVPISDTTGNSNELIQLVSFKLDNEEFGIEVLKVREIIRMVTITHMPNTPSYMEGVINLRGKVIPIVSMRKKFNLMESENNSHTRIIVMDVSGELMGFIVDAVSEVIRVSASEIQPPPNVVSGGIDQECITGVINQSERLLVLLNLEKLFSGDEKQLLGTF